MSAHSLQYPRWASAIPSCRAALQSGYLIQSGRHWLYGRRLFHPSTVNSLIDLGEAVRVGNCVVKFRPEMSA